MKVKSISILLLCAIMVFGLIGCKDVKSSKGEKVEGTKENTIQMEEGINYTVMIYMVGSNLESEGGAASLDILEMVKSGIDLKKNNVLIYTGGSKIWYIDGINSMTNSVIKLEEGENIQRVAETQISKNMGEPATLSEFITYCYDNYKANHYALICWNHGAGPIGGFGSDELYENDSLFAPEMKEALDNTPFASGEKLEFIGFDACLMASLEYADMLSTYANYMVASQEVEPGYGWDYSFLSILNESADPKEIATNIIDSYKNYYEANKTTYSNPDITLSCIDLNKAKDTIAALDGLFGKMSGDVSSETYISFATNRNNTKSYGLSATGGKGNSLDLIDLGDFAEKMSGEYDEEGEELKNAISKMVVYQSSNVEGTCGVSLYYPYDNKAYFNAIGQYLCGVENSSAYKGYISKFADIWMNNGNTVNEESKDIKLEENEYTYQLTKEQQKNLKKVTYTILEKLDESISESGAYRPIYAGCQVEPDENGVIHINRNQKVFYIETDDGSVLWEVEQISDNGSETIWKTKNTRIIDYSGALENGAQGDIEDIEIIFAEKEDGVIEIKEITVPNSDSEYTGKNNIDVMKWYGIYNYFGNMCVPTQNKKGKILPYSQWKAVTSAALATQTISVQDGFCIKRKSINDSQYQKQYAYQIIIEDNKGNMSASDIREIKSEKVYEEYTEEKESVKIRYHIYPDHAEVVGVDSEKKKIVIPDKINDIKITKICDMTGAKNAKEISLPSSIVTIEKQSFYGLTNLIKINIPESVERIGEDAFANCERLRNIKLPIALKIIQKGAFADTNISALNIPKTVKNIEGGAFGNNVEHILLEEGNETYELKDGVLFTKGLKKLVYYPHKEIIYDNESRVKTINYNIPEGVEEIGEKAFACEQLAHIKFPSTLKRINSGAFSNCGFLEEIKLPDSLETICSGAFLRAFRGKVKISIGKNVNYIGREAFGQNYITEYTVSEDNLFYNTLEGNLTNKAQDTLLFSKTKNGRTFKVPEGIIAIGKNGLDGIGEKYTEEDYVQEIVIPDSVQYINYWVDLSCKKWTVGSGLQYWDCAGRINKSVDDGEFFVSVSEENSYYKVENSKIVKK